MSDFLRDEPAGAYEAPDETEQDRVLGAMWLREQAANYEYMARICDEDFAEVYSARAAALRARADALAPPQPRPDLAWEAAWGDVARVRRPRAVSVRTDGGMHLIDPRRLAKR